MQLTVERRERAVVVTPSGRLDQTTVPDFQARLLEVLDETPGTAVIVDMAQVEFISSVGLRALNIGFKKSKAGGGSLSVAALRPIVREVFSISRFDKVLAVHEDLNAALAAVDAE
jgi:anti-anti-sigma factor